MWQRIQGTIFGRVDEYDLERLVQRFLRVATPYAPEDLDDMIADFYELEDLGFEVADVRSGRDVYDMLDIRIVATPICVGNPLETLERRWMESLRLGRESAHTIDETARRLRFATRGVVGFITGTVTIVRF